MSYYTEQTKRVNDMYATLKKSQTDQALAQKNQAITEQRRSLAEQLPQYQTARAQADVGQVQNMNKLKEYMANSGAFNSGDNLSRASGILAQRSNAVNQINGNQNTFTTGINNNIADANTAYNNSVNSIGSQLDAQKMQAIMSLQEQARQEQLAAASQAAARRTTSVRSNNSAANNSSKQLQTDYKSALNKVMDMKGAEKKRRVGTDEYGQTIYDYTPTYTDDDIINYAQNLGLPDEYVAKMLNAANVKAPVVTKSDNKYYNKGGYSLYSGGR